MTPAKVFRSKPSEIKAMQWTGGNFSDLKRWLGNSADSVTEDKALRFWCAASDMWLLVPKGDWVAEDALGFHPISAQVFSNRWTDDDDTSVEFNMNMVDGDRATVRVDGFKQVATAARALIHCGSPDVILNLLRSYAEQGDLSVVALANELGGLAEKKAGLHK